MDKKPLIGISFCVVVFLVLASFSNVVGYSSVKSAVVNTSPLFQTRTQKATNQERKVFTSQYLGMGTNKSIQFPIKDNETELIIKAIKIISEMDEKTFEKFTQLSLKRARQDDTFKDKNQSEIVQMLQLIRTQPTIVINQVESRTNRRLDPTNFNCNTILFGPTICFIFLAIIVIFVLVIFTPILVVLRLLTIANCPTMVVSQCPTQFNTYYNTYKVVVK